MLFLKNTFRHGGYVPQRKEATSHSIIWDMPLPEEVVIPLGTYAGESCEPCVLVGDEVRPGQIIGRGLRFPAVCHASATGTVVGITECSDVSSGNVPAVHIKVRDGQSFATLQCRVPDSMSPEELLEAVVEAGIQEEDPGGNTLYRRLSEARYQGATTLIINGIESEPYLTGRARSLWERSALMIYGARAALKLTGAARGVVALPGNEGELIGRYQELLADESALGVARLKPKYPQGDHNLLVRSVSGREVPAGQLPSAVGVVVLDVDTLVALGEALVCGKPMIDRVITVGGPGVANPGNYRVPLGTPLGHVLRHCGMVNDADYEVIWGGPMRGIRVDDLSIPINKSCQGIVVLPKTQKAHKEVPYGECVNCTRCVEQCPQRLYPNRLSMAAERMATKRLERNHVDACSECGLCSYVCPANRPITQMIRACKQALQCGEGGFDR